MDLKSFQRCSQEVLSSLGPAKNLVLGYDTFDSHIEYRVIDMKETTGDNEFRVIAISNIAVGIVLPELFVISKA